MSGTNNFFPICCFMAGWEGFLHSCTLHFLLISFIYSCVNNTGQGYFGELSKEKGWNSRRKMYIRGQLTMVVESSFMWLTWCETGQSIPLIHWVIRLGLLPFDLGPISQLLHHTVHQQQPGWMVSWEEETSQPGIWGMRGMRAGPNKPMVGL